MSSRLQRVRERASVTIKAIEDLLSGAVDAEGVERAFTTEEQEKHDKLQANLERDVAIIESEEKAAEALERAKAKAKAKTKAKAVAVVEDDADEDDDEPAPKVPAKKKGGRRNYSEIIRSVVGDGIIRAQSNLEVKMDVPMQLALMACAQAQVKAIGNSTTIYDRICDLGYEKIANDLFDSHQKALSAGTATAGAEMMPLSFSTEFIEFLRPQSAFLRAGPTYIPLETGYLRMSGGNVGASASYRAENADIAYTQATFRDIVLQAKNLSAVTAVSRELLMRSPVAVGVVVREDLVNAFSQAMDFAGLRGDGTGNAPTGVRNRIASGNRYAVTVAAAPTVVEIDTEVTKAIYKIVGQNVPLRRRVWVMSERSSLFLATVRGDNGERIYPTLDGPNPTWWGYPVVKSNIIPDNLGVGTDETEIYLVDMGHVYFGETSGIEVSVSDEASYVQGGNTISAFSRNQSVIRVLGSHDINMRHTTAGVCITGVRWGLPA